MLDQDLWHVLYNATPEEIEPIKELLSKKSVDWKPPESGYGVNGSIHDELLLSGGNTIVNLTRKGGPPWKEIVFDVAKKLEIDINDNNTTAEVEERVVVYVLERSVDSMTEEQKKEIYKELEKAGLPKNIPIGKGMLLAGMAAGRIGGFAVYKALPIIANAVVRVLIGRGLPHAANMAITRALSIVLGPIGWTVMAILTAIDIAGPAWRITIPSVVMIGILRLKQKE